MNRTRSVSRVKMIAAGATLFAIVVVGTVVAQSGGQGEVTDSGHSWPHEVIVQTMQHGQPVTKSANELLLEMHGLARSSYDGETPQNRIHINAIIESALTCLGYDGHIVLPEQPQGPMPAHHGTFGGQPSHSIAAQKIASAFLAMFPPPTVPATPPDWALAAGELQHGH